jgi:hypothetical protein
MATFTVDIPVGPIWNNDDAKIKCPEACAAHLGGFGETHRASNGGGL